MLTIINRVQGGKFDTYTQWCNKASSWISGRDAICVDTANRECRIGWQFMRARDEGTFPVTWWLPEEKGTI
jgi:hypothetical protein